MIESSPAWIVSGNRGRRSAAQVSAKVENAIRHHLSAGNGILKVAAMVGVGSGIVQRVKREMAGELAKAV